LADFGEQVGLDVYVLPFGYLFQPADHSVLLEGVEVDHDGAAAELLEAADEGVVADEDDGAVYFCFALLVLFLGLGGLLFGFGVVFCVPSRGFVISFSVFLLF
jgi:hypothetical protein